jgi:histidinol dehydrogenase
VIPTQGGGTPAGAAGVAEIVDDVRARGDAAVREWALRLDGVEPARAEPAG